MASFKASHDVKIDEGHILTLSHDVAARSQRKVNYQGSQWTAENISDTDLNVG